MITWLKQLFCSHTLRTWYTNVISETEKEITGGCVRCGKWFDPPCERYEK